jgi:hypothetical protein
MAELVDDDKDVKEENDFREGEQRKTGGDSPVVVTEGDDEKEKESEETKEPGISQDRTFHCDDLIIISQVLEVAVVKRS